MALFVSYEENEELWIQPQGQMKDFTAAIYECL